MKFAIIVQYTVRILHWVDNSSLRDPSFEKDFINKYLGMLHKISHFRLLVRLPENTTTNLPIAGFSVAKFICS